METIYLAGGCFWGMQRFINQFDGILKTTVGYANGITQNPTYEEVKSQRSGHTETVQVDYDEAIIPLHTILKYFYQAIDPTAINKQGGDEGISYRTGIYYIENTDLPKINKVTKEVQRQYNKTIVVEIKALENFYPAEEYHQNYLEKKPEGYCHIDGCLLNLGGKGNDINK